MIIKQNNIIRLFIYTVLLLLISTIILTLIAWFIRSPGMMSMTGLGAFIIVMFPVVLSDKISKFISYIIKYSDELRKLSDYIDSLAVYNFAKQFPYLFRAVIQIIGYWIVETFSSLSSFKSDFFSLINPGDLVFSLFMLIFGLLSQFQENDKWGRRFKWISEVTGNATFLRGLSLLVFGIVYPEKYQIAHTFASNPLWFLDYWLRFDIVGSTGIFNSLIMLVSGTGVIYLCIQILRDCRIKKETKYMAWGAIIDSIWLLTIPIYEIYSLIQYFSSKNK